MIEVSKDEFFAIIGKKNVHPTPVGKFPYTSHWKDQRTGKVVGISEPIDKRGVNDRYFILQRG